MTTDNARSAASNSHENAPQDDEALKGLNDAILRRAAARQLGQARSERKSAAVRENGKKGGRPAGTKTSAAAKARMREAQRQRRAREQASIVEAGSEN